MEYRNENGCRNIYCGQTKVPQTQRYTTPQTPRGEMMPPPPPPKPCDKPCVTAPGIPTLSGLPLAMVYSPNQEWCDIMCPEDALSQGTLFKQLVFPWNMSCCPSCVHARNGGCDNE